MFDFPESIEIGAATDKSSGLVIAESSPPTMNAAADETRQATAVTAAKNVNLGIILRELRRAAANDAHSSLVGYRLGREGSDKLRPREGYPVGNN